MPPRWPLCYSSANESQVTREQIWRYAHALDYKLGESATLSGRCLVGLLCLCYGEVGSWRGPKSLRATRLGEEIGFVKRGSRRAPRTGLAGVLAPAKDEAQLAAFRRLLRPQGRDSQTLANDPAAMRACFADAEHLPEAIDRAVNVSLFRLPARMHSVVSRYDLNQESVDEICRAVGLSRRQFFRDHRAALLKLAPFVVGEDVYATGATGGQAAFPTKPSPRPEAPQRGLLQRVFSTSAATAKR